jgi:murein DD-endopeptidase MepM/ murein hydrolase activator NlpD
MSTGSSRGKALRSIALAGLVVFAMGFGLPGQLVVPVAGASDADWNHDTFWHAPWGRSRVHKGIDIFARRGTPVVAASSGLVVFRGQIALGGNVAVVLGPKWRLHYYAHMEQTDVRMGAWVRQGDGLGAVGTTGNAADKPPHMHYSILTLIPYPWRASRGPQGLLRMFFLNPHEHLPSR